MNTKPRVFFIDAYALIFRSYYAFINRPIINSKGVNTSAVYGFTNSLIELIKTETPSHLAVVFDPPSPTFRSELFPEYKANRDETPEDIKLSVPLIKDLLDGFNISVIEVPNYEADDVIGTLAKRTSEQGCEVYMVTPDKDYGQLISESVFMYKPRKAGADIEIVDLEKIKEKYSIQRSDQVIDILALMGDAADNVPGVPGIGEKTAIKLIEKYGTVENLINNVNELKGKQKENVVNNLDQLKLSKKLVTIALDVPVDFEIDSIKLRSYNKDRLLELFKELEFRSIPERLFGQNTGTTENIKKPVQQDLFSQEIESSPETAANNKSIDTIEHKYKVIEDNGLDEFVTLLSKQEVFCFDTETTGLDSLSSEIVGLAISFKSSEGYYISFPANRETAKEKLNYFKDIFADSAKIAVGQNLKYDIQILSQYGIAVENKLFDTMIAHYLMYPEAKHNMDYLSEVYLGYTPVSIESLIGKKGNFQGNMRNVPLEKIKEYACEDADITWQLYLKLKDELEKSGLNHLFTDIEIPLLKVLSEVESYGVKLDVDSLKAYSLTLKDIVQNIEKEIFDLSGEKFNIASPKQMGEVLFEKMKIIDNPQKTKTKQYSTSEETLSKLRDIHPIIDKILKYRRLSKLISTYVDSLPNLINPQTNKIHTSFNQTIAATGRLSSVNPNLQNIPIREEEGREIRKAFIGSNSDFKIISVDYSQIELRLMAHMSGDKEMISAFKSGEDIHTATAAKIYKVSLSDVSKEQRSRAKTANFGIIYGISAFGLSQRLNIPRGEAKELIDGYFMSYPRVREYMNECVEIAKEKGFVTTLMGRKRWLKDINSGNAVVRGVAERNAINSPIQGSAADIIKIAMIQVFNFMKAEQLKSKMVLQVHDELVFDAHISEIDYLKENVIRIMENVVNLEVPLIAEAGIGQNWMEAH